MKRLIIIGGGIAGLAAAYRIQEELSANSIPLQCTVLEGGPKFGGKIATERKDGFILERGPDSFISQKPWALQLCKKIGLSDQLVGTNPKYSKTFVYLGKKLVQMPDGLSLMVPTKFLPFALSPLFSIPGKIRMGMDLIIPAKKNDKDESLASFIRRRLGQEALEKMAEPMLAGIYASNPETMSIKSTFPMFFQTEQKYRSLILGMLARKAQTIKTPSKNKPSSFSLFMTLKNGLGEMVDGIIDKCPDISFRTDTKVNGISKEGNVWQIKINDEETLEADAVIIASPANIAANLLESSSEKISELLRKIKYVSTAAVTVAYKKEGFSHDLNGFGFVVPKAEKRKIMACTWTSSKFPERVPEGHVLIRCFIGGALCEDLAEQTDQELEDMVKNELKEMMGITETPLFCRVFKNQKANVQYQVNHGELIEQVNEQLTSLPGMYLSGSAYTGIGIPDCILNGTKAAESAIQFLDESNSS
ncbi:MAG: protoporphyrinogen oxidase [Nitrospinales bacterium]